MRLAQASEAILDELEASADGQVRVFRFQPETVNPPAVMLGLPRPLYFDRTNRLGCNYIRELPIKIVLPRESERDFRQRLDQLEEWAVTTLEQSEALRAFGLLIIALAGPVAEQIAGGNYMTEDIICQVTVNFEEVATNGG